MALWSGSRSWLRSLTVAALVLALVAGVGPARDSSEGFDITRLAGVRAARADEPSPPEREELVERRNAWMKHYREPDGSYTAEIFATPVHFRDALGAWAEIDPSLVASEREGYAWAMRAGPVAIEFAANARSKDTLLIAAGNQSFTLGPMDAAAAEAVVDGSVITYPGVWPEADLRYTLSLRGIKEDVVLHADPGVDRFAFKVGGTLRVAEAADGGLAITTASGVTVYTVPPPIMRESEAPDADEPALSDALSFVVSGEPGDQVVELVFDRGWVTDPARVWPIVIDPSTTINPSPDTFVHATYPDTNFNTETDLRSGLNTDTGPARTLMKFSTSGMSGRTILSAKLRLYNWWSSSCTALQTEARRLTENWSGGSVTWNNKPAATSSGMATSSFAHGRSGCDPSGAWAEWEIANLYQGWVDGTWSNYGVLVRAADESDVRSWRRFYSMDNGSSLPRLVVSYNTPPSTPTNLSPASGTVSANNTPTLSGTYSDPDSGDSGHIKYEVYRSSNNALVASGNGSTVNPGGTSSWTVPSGKLDDGVQYYWRARAYDGVDFSSYTSNRNYRVNAPPGVPTSLSPAAGTVSTNNTPTLSGVFEDADSGDTGSVSFQVYRSSDDALIVSGSGNTVSPGQTSSWTVPAGNLLDGVAYYWRARGTDAIESGAWSANLAYRVNAPPGVPTNLEPPSGTVSGDNTPTLSGVFVDTDTSDTGNLDFEVYRASDAALIVTGTGDTVAAGQVSSWTVPEANLVDGVEYYWRARGTDGLEISAWTDAVVYALNTPPTSPTNLSPPSGTISPDNTPTLSGTLNGANTGWLEFEVYRSADAALIVSGTGSTVDPGQTSAWTVPASNLVDGVAYYWRARGSDGIDTGPWTLNITYTVNTPPDVPTDLAPATGTIDATATPTLSGTYADADGDLGFLKFEVYRSSDDVLVASGDGTVVASGETSSWTVPAASLVGATQYYWRAQTWDGYETSSFADDHTYIPDLSGPTGALTAPANGATVSGTISIEADPDDGSLGAGVASVEFSYISLGQSISIATDTDPADGWSATLDTTALPEGRLTLRAQYTDALGNVSCCAGGAGASVVVDNASPGAESWTAMVEMSGVAQTPGSDARVLLGAGEFLYGVEDASIPGLGFAAVFQRGYRSGAGQRGILGPGWRASVEDMLVPAASGSVLHIDGAGRERTFTPHTTAGLKATYYNSIDLSGAPALERTDAAINFDWGSGSPGAAVGSDGFSARWTGLVDIPSGGSWTFFATSDDGFRLFIDEVPAIDNWAAFSSSEISGTISLSAGLHEIRAEFFEATGNASVALSWEGPALTKQAVPASALRHATGAFDPPPGVYDTLIQAADGTFTLIDREDIEVQYGSNGRPQLVVDAVGNTLGVAYDASSRPAFVCVAAAICDEQSADLSFTYGDGDLLSTVGDRIGRQWSFAYLQDRLSSVTDPAGHVTSYSYDVNGPLTSVVDAAGGEATISYDTSGRVTAITDPEATAQAGPATTFSYDDPQADSVTVRTPEANAQIPAGMGSVHQLGASGELLAITNALGHTTTYTYDANLNMTSETASPPRLWTYDANGNVTSATDELGNTTSYSYDPDGNLTSVEDPLGNAVTYTYDANGNLLSETDPLGNETTYSYDASGQLLSTTDPLGNATTYAYDVRGNVASMTDPLGNVATYAYDGLGNVTSQTDADGNVSTFAYDELGNLTAETDPAGATTTYAYDALGRGVSRVTPEGNVPEADPTDFTLSTTYDLAGRIVAETDPLGHMTTYAYDWNGNLIAQVDPRGNEPGADPADFTTSYSYDAAGQLITETPPDAAQTTYVYNDHGQILSVTDPKGTTSYAYDAAGGLLSQTDPLGGVTTYSYDAAGRTVSRTDPGGNAPGAEPGAYTTTFSYDAAGQLTSVTDPLGNTTTYTYDAAGNQTSVVDPASNNTDFSLDSLGRVVRRETKGSEIASASGAIDALAGIPAETAFSIPTGGRIEAALAWDPVPATTSATLTGAIADGGSTETDLRAFGEAILEAELEWDPGTTTADDSFSGTVAATGVSTHEITVSATDASITAELDWAATQKAFSFANQSIAPGAKKNHFITPTAEGSIDATLDWTPGTTNLNLRLFNPSGTLVASATSSTTRPETLSYTVPAASVGGTFRLEVDNAGAFSTTYTLDGTYPFFADLDVELLEPGGSVVASATTASRPETLSYTPSQTGVFTLRVTSVDEAASYDLNASYPITAHANLTLSLLDPDGTIVRTSSGATPSLSVMHNAADPGGVYTVEITNDSPTTEVPAYTLQTTSTTVTAIQRTGVLAESASDTFSLVAEDAGTIRTELAWDAGTRVQSHTFDGSVGAFGNQTHAIVVTATDSDIQATLDWENVPDSGTQIPLYADLDLELRDPSGTLVAVFGTTNRPESLTHMPTTTGIYTLRVVSKDLPAVYHLDVSYPQTASAPVRLRLKDPSGNIVAEESGFSPLEVTYAAPDPGGPYTVVVTNQSADTDVPAYTLALRAPNATTYADLDLVLLDASGSIVAETADHAARPETLTFEAPAGGDYTLRVIANTFEADWRLDYSRPTLEVEETTYDASGRIAAITNAAGTTTYLYDAAGRLVKTLLPDGATLENTYDVAGRATQISSASGTHTLSYDAVGQITSATDVANVTTAYDYDAAGGLSKVTSPGDFFDFRRDPVGRLSARVESDGAQTSFSYADRVFPTKVEHPTGETDEFLYDALGQITTITRKPQPAALPTQVLSYSYDVQGNLTSAEDVTNAADPIEVAGHTYDEGDRLTSETILIDGSPETFTYAYDAQDNRTAVTGPGGTTSFTYNPAGQLTARTDPDGALTVYLYDGRGSLIQSSGPVGTTSYGWAPEGRLASVSLPDGTPVTYAYDPLGQRIQKSAGGIITNYSWEAGRLVSLERDGTTATFVYDDSGTPLSITTPDGTFAYRYDHRGTVVELTDTSTHEAALSFEWDAWGNLLGQTGSTQLAALNPFGFSGSFGLLADQETGLVAMGARHYDPAVGRFISRDPISADTSQSAYVYADNNPLVKVDPTGLRPLWAGSRRRAAAVVPRGLPSLDLKKWAPFAGKLSGKWVVGRMFEAVFPYHKGGMDFLLNRLPDLKRAIQYRDALLRLYASEEYHRSGGRLVGREIYLRLQTQRFAFRVLVRDRDKPLFDYYFTACVGALAARYRGRRVTCSFL